MHCFAAASGVSFARYGYRWRFRALQQVDRHGRQGVHGLEEVEDFLCELERVKVVVGRAHGVDLRFPCTR